MSCCFIMCAKVRSDTTVPILHNGTVHATSRMNAQLPHSSNVKTVSIQTVLTAVLSMPAHIPSSPICRIDLLSLATTVPPTSQQRQTIMAASGAKMGVNDLQETAFCAVSLAIGRRIVHSMAGCNHCLHSYLSIMSHSKKAEHCVVCCCM